MLRPNFVSFLIISHRNDSISSVFVSRLGPVFQTESRITMQITA